MSLTFSDLGFLSPIAQGSSKVPLGTSEDVSVQSSWRHHVEPGAASVQAINSASVAGMVFGGLAVARALRRRKRAHQTSKSLTCVAAAESGNVGVLERTEELSPIEVLEKYVKDHGGSKVIRKILIANNGMAATKAILSMRQWAYLELGLDSVFEFVVMATPEDLDANAEFIRLADIYVEVPGGKNVNNYANVDLICATAKAYDVDAVWPGWGHASENPKLPDGLSALGITFIGPTSPVMSVLGDKIAANILAQTAGVPSIPWSGDGLTANLTAEGTIPEDTFRQGTINSIEEAVACADRIGYPVMLKASEGGGGKGIRMSYTREDLEANYPQVLAEVPGSPVFMMQLCKGARHIEVQIVGDQHGNAVALNGRDCSTQRRFQKIFEEGPPTIVPKDTFKEMERAAQRLTQNIGYIGAGTVEYLYNAQSNEFYFLELNPRLQVEHPVTEELSQVNLPATQLQVLMGIPLEKIPQVRRFYGKASDDDTSSIDFLADDYVYPTKHVIAARITAENPDDGFKPTSGRIQRIKFQSSVSCWGYFSVGANGGIHEFADSQFGHIFAHGATREDARKALMLSLKNINVVGEIRNPVEYLVELAGTDAFRDNTIDTSWLDGLIKEKSVAVKYNSFDVVFYAAVFRAMETLKASEAEVLDALGKSQLVPLYSIGNNNTFPIDITFEGQKFELKVARTGPDMLSLTIGSQEIQAKVRTQPDGAIFVSVGNSVMKFSGTEEPLGLRLRLENVATIMVPTIYDPSELRSEFNGKIVRYLHDNGAQVKAGQPYVELEAMKMIMPVKASASGKITHTRGVGSIVSAGDLLGSLELEDASSITKIVPFQGEFTLTATMPATADSESQESLQHEIDCVLNGYAPARAPSKLIQEYFANVEIGKYSDVSTPIFEKYLAVEEQFAQLSANKTISADQIYLALISANKDNLEKVASLALAHGQLASRNELVLAALRDLRLGLKTSSSELEACLKRLAALPSSKDYGEITLLAKQVLEKMSSLPFEERCQNLRRTLEAADVDFSAICAGPAAQGGVELLGELLGDASSTVRSNALEGFVRRTYRSSNMPELKVSDEGPSRMKCEWKFSFPGAQEENSPMREGFAVVVPKFEDVESVLTGDIPLQILPSGQLTNSLQIIIGPRAFSEVKEAEGFFGSNDELQSLIPKLESMLKNMDGILRAKGVSKFVVTCLQGNCVPRYVCFLAESNWCEDSSRRDMHPTLPHLLEINVLSDNYVLKRIVATIGRNSQVYVGTMKDAETGKRGPPRTIFARMITHTMKAKLGGKDWTVWPETLLLSAIDEVERARLNPNVGQQPSSQIYAHFMWLVDASPTEVSEAFKSFMNQFVSKHGLRLQQMKVDEIVLKVGIGSEATGRTNTLRLTASSMTGEYLRMTSLLEKEDPLTGRPIEFKDVQSGDVYDFTQTSQLGKRRSIARAVGSTYAPEFLGMMKVELVSRWDAYIQQQTDVEMPSNVFESKELVLSADGTLKESDRRPGENNIRKVAWRCTMRTPEYPQGGAIILIANDVTHQAGSFGVAEDVFFQKASEFARAKGLPRIYIACNSGARVGLVEELKPYIRAAWTDPEDPSKGFDYLYLEEADYKRFDEGTVEAREVDAEDGKRFMLEAIIGEGQKSTAGGIGVENLQGSGLIAGETSRAYNEVFTLSYVTGRSVGIGAYLNRLGQRTIQMAQGPMILTGYGALNKLLGRSVYTSQDQLGGPQVMVPNGVTHQLVQNDQEGVSAILDWLSYVPKDTWSIPPMTAQADPVDRDVSFVPSKRPYDPRHMMAGTTTPEGQTLTGFFDEGSFKEYLEGWGKSVVVGRATLGGIPMGVIAVETRGMERRVPADPANPESQEGIEPQAGQVWFPDSAFKTATAIRDFNRGENLPLIVFANWRGFSGGTRDMYQEVLKFGAQIVDALVEYKNPVFMYIPPGGELRGGAWVVIDPAINPDQMEMYADVDSRGGILEPAGIVEVKYRAAQQIELMHKLDTELRELDETLRIDESAEVAISVADIQTKIKAREQKLLPLYTQIACEFADLHDRTGRMLAKGVIRGALEWRRSRNFFYWRVRRRLMEQDATARMRAADQELPVQQAKELLASWVEGDDDRAAVAFLENNSLDEQIESIRIAALKRRIMKLKEALPESEQASLLS